MSNIHESNLPSHSRVKKRYIIMLIVLIITCVAGLFFPEDPMLFRNDDIAVDKADTAWMMTASILVLLMTPGVAFFYAGMVRAKNVISTMVFSVVAMGAMSVIWVVFGFSLVFGDDINGFIGNPFTYFMLSGVGSYTHSELAPTIPFMLFVLFQMKFAILAPSLISGGFAERIRFSVFLIFMVLFSILIYAPIAHWIWHPQGIFRQLGVIDFAGGLVVHTSSGIAALVGAIYLGSRHMPSDYKPANIPFMILGVALLWIGWFGFNAGSALGINATAIKAFVNTNTASAVGMLGWVFFDAIKGKKPSALGLGIGAIVGMVGITPCAGMTTIGESMFIGLATALLCNYFVSKKSVIKADDALDVFYTHGVGGIIGSIFTGIFVHGLLDGNYDMFLYHLLAVVVVIIYTFVLSYGIFWLIAKFIPPRVSLEKEKIGLDLNQHGEVYGLNALKE